MLPAAAEEEEIPADDTDAEAILRLRVDHDGLKLGFKGVLCLAPAWTEDACQQSNFGSLGVPTPASPPDQVRTKCGWREA